MTHTHMCTAYTLLDNAISLGPNLNTPLFVFLVIFLLLFTKCNSSYGTFGRNKKHHLSSVSMQSGNVWESQRHISLLKLFTCTFQLLMLRKECFLFKTSLISNTIHFLYVSKNEKSVRRKDLLYLRLSSSFPYSSSSC